MPIIVDAGATSRDWNLDRQGLIKGALRLCGGVDFAADPSAPVAAIAQEALNGYIKHLMSRGPHLWRQTEGVLFLRADAQYYDLGPEGDHATREEDFISTTLSAAHALGATTLNLAADDGLVVGDYIGIELADGARQWAQIATTPGGDAVTVDTALTGPADSGATVYSYTTRIERPTRITSLRRRVSASDTPLDLVSRDEYFAQANKTVAGKVNMVHYARLLDHGRLYVWPTADNVEDTLRFTFERTLEDMDANDDYLDMPVEWVETIRYGLGYRLATELGRPLERILFLKREAEQREAELLAFDQEDASISFAPDLR